MAGILVWADRRFRMGHGRVFALYVVLYTAGRGVIETVRIDEANTIAGLRVNVWVSGLVFVGGLIYLMVSARLRPGRETVVEPREQTDPDADAVSDDEPGTLAAGKLAEATVERPTEE